MWAWLASLFSSSGSAAGASSAGASASAGGASAAGGSGAAGAAGGGGAAAGGGMNFGQMFGAVMNSGGGGSGGGGGGSSDPSAIANANFNATMLPGFPGIPSLNELGVKATPSGRYQPDPAQASEHIDWNQPLTEIIKSGLNQELSKYGIHLGQQDTSGATKAGNDASLQTKDNLKNTTSDVINSSQTAKADIGGTLKNVLA